MRKFIFLAVFSTMLWTAAGQNGVIYVNPTLWQPGNTGLYAWSNALDDLQQAINVASTMNPIPDIWVVASATPYTPTQRIPGGTSDRDKSFFIYNKDIKIYGGFPNSNTATWADRDPKTNVTTLSGSSDDCYHVVVAMETTGGILDGFTITGGNANGSQGLDYYVDDNTIYSIPRNNGGGILLLSSSMQLTDLVVEGNTASNHGGGISSNHSGFRDKNGNNWEYGSIQHPILNRLLITNNSASEGGGIFAGYYNVFGNINCITILNTLIHTNTASTGGGISTLNGAILFNLTIADNLATSSSSAINATSYSAIVRISNSIVKGTTTHAGNLITNYSLVDGVNSTSNHNLPADITTPLFADQANKNYRLQFNSPCINVGISRSDADLDGNLCIDGKKDIGAYEYTVKPDNNGIVYVKKNGIGDGSSWNNALGEVAYALHCARQNTNIHNIYVAQGVYHPSFAADGSSTNPKDMAFVLPNDVKIFGGFPANSNNNTTFNQRDAIANPTVLSGFTTPAGTEKVYHVVIAVNSAMPHLTGFIVQNGSAVGSGSITVNGHSVHRNCGGGIYAASVDIRLSDMQVFENEASDYGGGIYSDNISYNEWTYISIIGNRAEMGGGMYNVNATNSTIYNLRLCGNIAETEGSAMYNIRSSPAIYNALIAQNEIKSTKYNGGAVFNQESSPVFNNTSIVISLPDGIGMINNDPQCNPTLCNSIIWNGRMSTRQSVIDPANTTSYNYCLIQGMTPQGNRNLPGNIDPLFVNPVYQSYYMTHYGDYHLISGSPCIDMGDNSCAMVSTGDLDKNMRIVNTAIDLGCYEYNTSVIFWLTPHATAPNYPFHKSVDTENEFIPQAEDIFLSNLSLKVYPNPSASGEQVKLFLGEDNFYYDNPVEVAIYSMDGRLIHNSQYSNGNITLNMPQLPSGIYMINTRTQEGKTYKTKLVITR